MSKDIDLSKPLSDEDREWLLARGRTADVAANDGVTIQELEASEHEANDGEPVFTPASPADRAALQDRLSSGSSGANNDSDDYNDWDKEALKAEAENRGLAKSGNKSELVERLEENDAEEA